MNDNRVDALYPSTNDRTRDPSIVAEQNSHHDLASNILSTEPTVTRKVVPSLCKGWDTNRIRILSKGREKWREIIYAVLSHARDTRRG